MLRNGRVASVTLLPLTLPPLPLPPVPGPVSSMRFESVTDRSVTVLWSPPEHHNGLLTGYTLRRMVQGQEHTLVEQNVTAEVTRLEVDNLRVSSRGDGGWVGGGGGRRGEG